MIDITLQWICITWLSYIFQTYGSFIPIKYISQFLHWTPSNTLYPLPDSTQNLPSKCDSYEIYIIMWWLARTSIKIIAVWLNIHMFNTLTRIVSQTLLSQVKTLKGFLQCTSMNIPVDSFPQVLFAMHLYSPLWFLLMLMIVSSFPIVTWPVLAFFQETFRGGVPAVTLHSFITLLPSSTATFCICSKTAGTRRDEREKWVFQ